MIVAKYWISTVIDISIELCDDDTLLSRLSADSKIIPDFSSSAKE